MAAPSALIVLLTQTVGGPSPAPEVLSGLRRDFLRQIAEAEAPRMADGERRQVTSGVFAGAEVLPLSSGPSLMAQSFVLTQPMKSGAARVVGQVQLVVETETCYLRSAALVGAGFPPGSWSSALDRGQVKLQGPLQFPSAPLVAEVSPLRVKVMGHGAAPDVARVLHEAAAINLPALWKLGPVRSELLAIACAHFADKVTPALRVHRDLVIDYTQAESKAESSPAEAQLSPSREREDRRNALNPSPWPLAPPKCRLHSSPFAHLLKLEPESETSSRLLAQGSDPEAKGAAQASRAGADTASSKETDSWSPVACLDWLAERATTALTRLAPEVFTVKERQGRWVALDPGRTAGLLVGKRLTSFNGAKLHVIRQIAVSESPDRVIAFIRNEPAGQPVSAGDSVRLDPALYPAQNNSGQGL